MVFCSFLVNEPYFSMVFIFWDERLFCIFSAYFMSTGILAATGSARNAPRIPNIPAPITTDKKPQRAAYLRGGDSHAVLLSAEHLSHFSYERLELARGEVLFVHLFGHFAQYGRLYLDDWVLRWV
jgi:hypothetical protein